MSGEIITGIVENLSGVVENLSGVVDTGVVSSNGFLEGSLISSPSVFWFWLWGLVKSIGSWCLGYWYVPVFIIAVYVFLLVGYNLLWGYLLSKLQKKNDESGKNN